MNGNSLVPKHVDDKLPIVKSSLISMSPIFIDDTNPDHNWSKTALENEWITGTGTWNDPYLIEGLNFISISRVNSAISIQNSQVPFIIRDCLFLNCHYHGIDLDYVSHGNITENIFINGSSSDPYRHSVDIRYCENLTLLNNDFYYEEDKSIYVFNGSMMKIDSNRAVESDSDMSLYYVDNSSFTGNSFSMRFWGCHYNEITDNVMINIKYTPKDSGYSLNLINSDYNNITRNTIYSNYMTLYLEGGCDHNIISLNNISGQNGIRFWGGGSFNTIMYNRIEFIDDDGDVIGGHGGISIASESVYNSILFNFISHFSTAVYLARPSNVVHAKYCTVMNNTFFEVGECIDYDESDGHVIENNTCILYQHPPETISGYSLILFAFLPMSIIGIILLLRKKIDF